MGDKKIHNVSQKSTHTLKANVTYRLFPTLPAKEDSINAQDCNELNSEKIE